MSKKSKDVMHLERESVVAVSKPMLVLQLTKKMEQGPERAEFLKFCKRVEYTIRAWYLLQFEDMMQLYALFNPLSGNKRLKEQNISSEEMDVLEQNFLTSLFKTMEKSNFKMATDKEVENALSGQYLLNLPIAVDLSKLDAQLLTKYFQDHPRDNLPKNYDKYIIYRRGFGTDRKTGCFYMEKLNMIIERVWSWFLNVTRLQGIQSTTRRKGNVEVPKNPDETGQKREQGELTVERIRIQNMELSMKNLYREITIKEPTFDRMIVVYRRVSTNVEEPDRGIYIKHFKSIPMADMEIVLPEKKNPSLTPMDWAKYIVTTIIGLVALISSSFKSPKAELGVLKGIIFTFVSYIANEYFTFQQNLATYQNLITESMYEKQLDSGRGTLLHLCDDVINQEVKEVIIAFYILMTQGKEGNLTRTELDEKCERFIDDEFNEKCNFDVDDAVEKLQKLGIITIDPSGRIQCAKLEHANNEILGTTTEELVLKAKQGATAANEKEKQPAASLNI